MPSENVIIKVNADDLDAKLSKSMRELGAHHDEYGRLLNAEEKYIGSLSQANVRMGYYIDSQGKMRDANGRLVEGLKAAERALRMYIDAHGDVRSAEGEFVRASDAKVEALKREQQELRQARQMEAVQFAAQMQGLAAMSQFAGILSQTGGTVGIVSNEFAKLAITVGSGATAVSGMKAAFKGLVGAGGVLGAVASFLSPIVAVVATFIAALKAGETAGEWLFNPGHGDPADPIKKRVEAVNELNIALAKYKVTASSLERYSTDKLFSVAASAAGTSQTDLMRARMLQIEKLSDDLKKSNAKVSEAEKNLADANVKFQQAGALGGMMPSNRFTAAAANYRATETEWNKAKAQQNADAEALRAANAEYIQAMKEMIANDVKADPIKEIAERASIYADMMQQLSGDTVNAAEAQKALAAACENYAAQFRLDSVQNLNEALDRASKDFKEGSEEYKVAVSKIKEAFEKNELTKSQNYVESLREQMKTPADRLREEQDKLADAFRRGVISFEEFAEMNQYLKDKYEEKVEEAEEPEETREPEYTPPKSAAYGSQAFYELMTQRENDQWRDKLQNTVSDVKAQQEESNGYLRDMRDGILAIKDVGVTA